MNQATVENTEIVSLLQPILSDGFQGLPKALESIINLAMQFERERHLQAARYERTQTRDGFANGFKPKTLKTSVGPLDLQIPQVRGCSTPFYPSCLEKGTRIDRSVFKDSRLCTWLEENLPDAFSVYQFPEALRRRIRTNNIEENLNRQIKRRTNLITVFPNENSMLRLVASICMEISQEWEAHAIYLDVRNL